MVEYYLKSNPNNFRMLRECDFWQILSSLDSGKVYNLGEFSIIKVDPPEIITRYLVRVPILENFEMWWSKDQLLDYCEGHVDYPVHFINDMVIGLEYKVGTKYVKKFQGWKLSDFPTPYNPLDKENKAKS